MGGGAGLCLCVSVSVFCVPRPVTMRVPVARLWPRWEGAFIHSSPKASRDPQPATSGGAPATLSVPRPVPGTTVVFPCAFRLRFASPLLAGARRSFRTVAALRHSWSLPLHLLFLSLHYLRPLLLLLLHHMPLHMQGHRHRRHRPRPSSVLLHVHFSYVPPLR